MSTESEKRVALLEELVWLSMGASSHGSLHALIFPNIAALEAFDVSTPTTTPDGSLAVVLSNRSLWQLGVGTGGDVDNITIASVTGGTTFQRWLRANVSMALPIYLAQRDWYISSAGNDEADGKGPATALKTNAEVFRRWGYTWEPNLTGIATFTIHHLTPSTDGSDPTFYGPWLENGATFVQSSPLPAPAFTGTLNAVTAKNHATNTALESTFTVTTGAIAVDMVLVNTTRGSSRSIAIRNLGAGNWLLAQPLAAYAGGFPALTVVDTWAAGDTIVGYQMTAVDIARIGAKASTLNGSFDPSHLVQDITIIDGNVNFGSLLIDGEPFAVLEDCPCTRSILFNGNGTLIAENATSDGVSFSGPGLSIWGGGSIGGGSIIESNWFGPNLFIETIIRGTCDAAGNPGTAYIDTGGTLSVNGRSQMISSLQALYGPGTLNVVGSLTCDGTATGMLPIATKKLNGVATGYSFATVAGVTTVHGGIALSSANLDAAAGAAGFGGFAQGGGAFISLSGLQP